MIKTPAWPKRTISTLYQPASGSASSRSSLLARGVLLIILGCSGCPKIDPNFSLDLQLISGDNTSSIEALDRGKHIVRLSFLRRNPAADPQGIDIRDFELICDRVFMPNDELEFLVPNTPDPMVTLRVEVFSADETKTLLYSGQRRDVQLTLEAGSTTILLFPAATVVKTSNRAVDFRAFHTATLLPNGQVMIIGGVIADSPQNTQTEGKLQQIAYVTNSIEIFDPSTLSFTKLKKNLDSPRAFHQAHLLPSLPDGTFRVLVYGGVKPANIEQSTFQVRPAIIPFLFTPLDSSEAAEALLISYQPGPEPVISVIPLPDFPKTMFPAMGEALSQNRIAFAGGGLFAGSSYATGEASYGFNGDDATVWVTLTDQPPVPEDQQRLNQIRVGHAMAQLGDTYLVLGGQMTGEVEDNGEFLKLGAAPTLANITPLHATSWHTLTSLGASDRELAASIAPTAVLWAGGINLGDEQSSNLRSSGTSLHIPALQWLKSNAFSFQEVPPNPPADPPSDDPEAIADFQSVGYHDAIRLHDGSVLLSGGNCPKGTAEIFCGHKQLVICTLEDNAVFCLPSPARLFTGRFGHRATRLLDNTVLITGGITAQGTFGQLLKDAEIFNPRIGLASEDYPFDRDPAAEKNRCEDSPKND